MAFYAAMAETIHAYTGLSLTAFFTILALMFGAYRLVSSMFVSDEPEPQPMQPPPPPPEPVQLGDVALEELKAYDGTDPKKPLLMAIKGQIYDVSRSRMFYGPGGPYALFAGRDASRALALMSFDHNDLTGNLEGLSSAELEVLQDWEYKFMEKYVKVGQLISENPRNADDNESNEMATNTNQDADRHNEDVKEKDTAETQVA
ncbi:membrane-associated progesterone receptor component protein [Dioscorea alata]|uniref:Membrane-associated progesterone receptor component protein n=1 Tax=Dioscorea alata TaxID=55571 RepID=A0ACB7VS55_DIOAL|nr:membrane-associated progesterone receptor component protein [Dioscorea alata]